MNKFVLPVNKAEQNKEVYVKAVEIYHEKFFAACVSHKLTKHDTSSGFRFSEEPSSPSYW